MAKIVENPQVVAIRKAIEDNKAVLGAKRTLKGMRKAEFSQVYITNNADGVLAEDVMHYSKVTGIPVTELEMNNKELGVVCKKPFIVSVLAVQK